MDVELRHGGNRASMARVLGCAPSRLLDASASLVPWSARLPRFLAAEIRHYPDRHHRVLCGCLSALHHLDPEAVLVGNGAAELFTWVARDAAACGLSVQPAPGFADYSRALNSWQGSLRQQPLPLNWASAFPQPMPDPGPGEVLWICNPQNPTGQLWSRDSLEPLLKRFRLVICEAFLPLFLKANGNRWFARGRSSQPGGDSQPHQVVWHCRRRCTPLHNRSACGVGPSGVTLAVNGTLAVGEHLLAHPARHQRWCRRSKDGLRPKGPGCSSSWLSCQESPRCHRRLISC